MSFVRSGSLLSRGKDTTLKLNLINELSECVKDIQYSSQVEHDWTGVVCTGDSASSLCDVLEAVLLHGLKDSLLRRARAFADPARRSQYDFWSLVLVVSHRQSVEQIAALPHISGPVGQCRAWLRAALNDCLLSSYLATLVCNTDAVRPFYSRSAFARDPESLELVRGLVEGLETCAQFRLPLNSSLLNDWPDNVLRAAGLPGGTIRPAPIATALDVVSTLPDTPIPHTPTTLLVRTADSTAFPLDEDEAIRFILAERSVTSTERIERDSVSISTEYEKPSQTEHTEKYVSPVHKCDPIDTTTYSSCDNKTINPSDYNTSVQPSCDTLCPISDADINVSENRASLNTDDNISQNLASPNTDDNFSQNLPCPNADDNVSQNSIFPNTDYDVCQNPASLNIDDEVSHTPAEDTSDLRDAIHDMRSLLAKELTTAERDAEQRQLGFETVGESHFTVDEWERLTMRLGRLSRELGLDSQNYQCADCQDSVGGAASQARVCAFSAEYFCNECMDSEAWVIPARVVHNWDFGRYAVSLRAARFLLEVQHRPLLDVRSLNPRAYRGAAALRVVHDLRVRLGLLRAYAETCRERERLGAEWRRMLWPREYLCESVHVYAPADLGQVPTGSLAAVLERVAVFLRDHVLSCWLCSQKGFVCEVCRAPDLLYPFDSGAVYRCETCSGVFHASCVRAGALCPRCVRRAARDRPALAPAPTFRV